MDEFQREIWVMDYPRLRCRTGMNETLFRTTTVTNNATALGRCEFYPSHTRSGSSPSPGAGGARRAGDSTDGHGKDTELSDSPHRTDGRGREGHESSRSATHS